MIKSIFISILVILTAVLYPTIKDYLELMHAFEDKLPIIGNLNECELRKEVQGCESIVIHEPSGTAFLACVDPKERIKWNPASERFDASAQSIGKIYVFNPETKSFKSLGLKNFNNERHFLGISIFDNEDNTLTIAVVNHPKTTPSSVELFSHVLGTDELVHFESFVDTSILKRPNSVVLTGKNSFYVSNDAKFEGGILRSLEKYLRVKTGHVVYKNEKGRARIVASGINWANGIIISKDGTHVFVASTTYGLVNVYEKTLTNGLRYLDKIKLPFIIDNLSLDHETDTIYAAGFTKNVISYINNPLNTISGSMAAKIYEDKDAKFYGRKFKTEIVYSDDGNIISGSTHLVTSLKHAYSLIGALYFPGTLYCPKSF